MPNLVEAPEGVGSAAPSRLIEFLREQYNPFDVFIASHSDVELLSSSNVPEINKEASHAFQAIIDRYRQPEERLPKSGACVFFGRRGAGKTHLLQLIRSDNVGPRSAIVIAPRVYEQGIEFEEYLCRQFVQHLQDSGDNHLKGMLERVADAFTKRLVRQGVLSMSPNEWLAYEADSSARFWQYCLGWHTDQTLRNRRELCQRLQLEDDVPLQDLASLCETPLGLLRRAADRELARIDETIKTPADRIRQGVYRRLVEVSFDRTRQGFEEYLISGFASDQALESVSRTALADYLLDALIEVCLFASVPVIFAMDALETLFGDPPDPEVVRGFFNGLANVIESRPGLGFVFLAEIGHWQQVQLAIPEYARHRLEQGVTRVAGTGTIRQVNLDAPPKEALLALVRRRLKPLLTDFFQGSLCPDNDLLPFQMQDLPSGFFATKGSEPPLRQIVQQLHDRYQEIVFDQVESPEPVLGDIERWSFLLRESETRASKGLTGLTSELNVGLREWGRCILQEGLTPSSGHLKDVRSVSFGNHSMLGNGVEFLWEMDGKPHRRGFVLLLGEKAAMPRDMQVKLSSLKGSQRVFDSLVVLWPREIGTAPSVVDALPTATRGHWDRAMKNGDPVQLLAVSIRDCALWLTLSRGAKSLAGETGSDPSRVAYWAREMTKEVILDSLQPKET